MGGTRGEKEKIKKNLCHIYFDIGTLSLRYAA